MNRDKLSEIIEQLKKERRTLAQSIAENDARFEEITESRENRTGGTGRLRKNA